MQGCGRGLWRGGAREGRKVGVAGKWRLGGVRAGLGGARGSGGAGPEGGWGRAGCGQSQGQGLGRGGNMGCGRAWAWPGRVGRGRRVRGRGRGMRAGRGPDWALVARGGAGRASWAPAATPGWTARARLGRSLSGHGAHVGAGCPRWPGPPVSRGRTNGRTDGRTGAGRQHHAGSPGGERRWTRPGSGPGPAAAPGVRGRPAPPAAQHVSPAGAGGFVLGAAARAPGVPGRPRTLHPAGGCSHRLGEAALRSSPATCCPARGRGPVSARASGAGARVEEFAPEWAEQRVTGQPVEAHFPAGRLAGLLNSSWTALATERRRRGR